MTSTLHAGDPATIGPFQLAGRLRDHEAGVVFLGYDSAGRAAAVSVLHAGAAADAAVRDRFAAALDDLVRQAPHDVMTASPGDPLPWVATTYTGGVPDQALALLDAAALSRAAGLSAGAGGLVGPAAQSGGASRARTERVTGPDFAPHWSGTQAAGQLAPSSPPRLTTSGIVPPANNRRSLAILGLCVAVAMAVVVGGGLLVMNLLGRQKDSGTRAETTSRPIPSMTAPAWPPREPSRRPTGEGVDGPPGLVVGPTFGTDEPTYLMDLGGFPFDFRVPGSWGCIRSSKAGPGATRWVCIDEGYVFGSKTGDPPGGIIEVRDCPAPCGSDEWSVVRDTLPVRGEWRNVDDSTMYAEWQVPDQPERVAVAMSHVFSSESDGSVDTHVAVRLTGSTEELSDLQKILNDIRANTP